MQRLEVSGVVYRSLGVKGLIAGIPNKEIHEQLNNWSVFCYCF